MVLEKKLSKNTINMKPSMIRELVSTIKTVPDIISFAGGFPAPCTFPVKQLAELYKKVIIECGEEVLQYGASEGDSKLLDSILNFEKISGLTKEEIIPTNGATNGIYYITRALVNPGEVVLCEAPSFLGSLVTYEAIEAEIHGISLEEDGINLDILEETVERLLKQGKKIKILYLIPDFQNPSGITMSYEKRKKTIEMAIKHDFTILEDNPYQLLNYSDKQIPGLINIARDEYKRKDVVISVKSMSKILGPGLRIGYVMADERFIKAICSWAQKINISPCGITQRVLAEFFESIDNQTYLIKEEYSCLRDVMLESLKKYMPEGVKWTKPDGGMFIWIQLPDEIDTDSMFKTAINNKIAYIPGSRFYPQDENKIPVNCLRLNFSYAKKESIEKGIKKLSEIIHKEIIKKG